MGEFSEARKKFAACLPKLPSDTVKLFVRQVVSIIKNNALHPCGLENISKRHADSSFKVMSNGIWSSNFLNKEPMNPNHMALANQKQEERLSKKMLNFP